MQDIFSTEAKLKEKHAKYSTKIYDSPPFVEWVIIDEGVRIFSHAVLMKKVSFLHLTACVVNVNFWHPLERNRLLSACSDSTASITLRIYRSSEASPAENMRNISPSYTFITVAL